MFFRKVLPLIWCSLPLLWGNPLRPRERSSTARPNRTPPIFRRRVSNKRLSVREPFLSLIFLRLSRESLNTLLNRRMSREKVPDTCCRERLNDKEMRRGRRGHQRHSFRIGIQLLQGARKRIGIVRDSCASCVSLIFARA